MNVLVQAMLPELILAATACLLFLLGISRRVAMRKLAPVLSILALVAVFVLEINREGTGLTLADRFGTFRVFEFAYYIKLLAAGVGVLLVLLAWPTMRDGTGNGSLDFGPEAGEFFALMLLSIAGVFLVAGANDMILLFLGIELASIPTYIMVSISRPIPVAQEAGVKYFFLGAMAAAVMLFGFSYLYGTTGTTSLAEITKALYPTGSIDGARIALTSWQRLAVVMLIAGFAFKIAAVPLHFYAGDVYQGAATPVTAFLSFVPKTSGMVALIKLLFVIGAASWGVPTFVFKLLWVLAVLTMTFGNVLGLLQNNIKRVLAYSSIAHSGYMLVGLTALCSTSGAGNVRNDALQGVLFYLTAYGIMNAGAFGVLMLLPARPPAFGTHAGYVPPATTAETFDDIAGQGRRHVGLGLAMAVCCFSLIGIPLTVGFLGKLLLIKPALTIGGPMMVWLVVIMLVNAAISAGYYLRIVAAMFLRPEPSEEPYGIAADESAPSAPPAVALTAGGGSPLPILISIALSVAGTLLFGAIVPATQVLSVRTNTAATVEGRTLAPDLGADEEPDETAPPDAPTDAEPPATPASAVVAPAR